MVGRRTQLIAFDKNEHIDPSLVDKATLWMLRALLKLGAHRKFIDKDADFLSEEICYFLDLGVYGEMKSGEYTRSEVIMLMQKNLQRLEAKESSLTSHPILSKNIEKLSAIMQLSSLEKRVLEFTVVLHQYEIVRDVMDYFGHDLNTLQVKSMLGAILNISKKEIDVVFSMRSQLSRSAIVTIDKRNTNSLRSKLDSINNGKFLDMLLSQDENIEEMLRDIIKPLQKSALGLKNYKHIQKDIDILVPYLKSALSTKQTGVNILLYGLPGTGKTELAKVVAQQLKASIFEVSYIDDDEEPIDGQERLKAYKSAQVILSRKKTLLMYDEAEDVFESSQSFFAPPQRQRDKAWLNRILETNSVPTIWITNNINAIDNALVRRFDISIELPIPPKSTREEILKNYTHDMLDVEMLHELSKHENIAPAVVASAAKVASKLSTEQKEMAFEHILNNTLKAQGHKAIEHKKNDAMDTIYNPSYVNADQDLHKLASGLKSAGDARICLYGAPGTGKSAYAKFIAKELDKSIIIKKASDLLGMYVGQSEKNIARAFYEAKEEDAVLVFDEVDSFLGERSGAQRSWEVSQVNEMLVQMESFEGLFIATTNLIKNLDKASLRRFDLKLEFKYLTPKQTQELFSHYAIRFGFKKLSPKTLEQVAMLRCVAPGDFAAIMRQSRFQAISSEWDLLERLKGEVEIKNIANSKSMGFLR